MPKAHGSYQPGCNPPRLSPPDALGVACRRLSRSKHSDKLWRGLAEARWDSWAREGGGVGFLGSCQRQVSYELDSELNFRYACRRRRCGDLEHPAVGRLQRRRAGGARGGIARASRPVRDGQALARIGSPAAAAVLDLRNPARAGRDSAGRVAAQQAHRRRHRAPLRDRAWRARGMSRTARPALRAGRSAGGSLDGRRRRRPRAVRHAGRGARARAARRPACSTARAAPPSCTTSSCSNVSASSRCWPPKTGAAARGVT